MSTSHSMHRPQRVVAVFSALLFVLAALPTILAATAEPASANTLTPAWTYLSGSSAPTYAASPGYSQGLAYASMAFDPISGSLIFFGGSNTSQKCGGTTCGVNSNLTWSWNSTNSTWTQLSPATSPPARSGASMAYDPATQQLLLFGGNDQSDNSLNDTWTWNGTTWSQLSPATSPPGRSGASMAYDPITGQMLLFGGLDQSNNFLNDTWTWNGSTWSQLSLATSPSARYLASMAFDSSTGQMLLFGGTTGLSGTLTLDDTWTWNGSTWIQLSPATSPGARYSASMAFNPSTSQMVLTGGTYNLFNYYDTWTWDGSTWIQLSPSGYTPPAVGGSAMAYDQTSGVMILTGGLGEIYNSEATFAFGVATPNTSSWINAAPEAAPSARSQAAMSVNDVDGSVVLFGGQDANGTALADTWIWTGSDWTQLAPATSPSARYGASTAFDETDNQLLLFGGTDGSPRNDTWAWNGTTWTQLFPTTSPPARSQASMAFDPATGNVMLFGGIGAGGFARSDLWVWNGTDWTELFPFSGSGNPMPRWGANLAFDPGSGQMVLFGGNGNGTYYNDTWGWNGTTWTLYNPVTAPPTRAGAVMDFDLATGQLILFGGNNANTYLSDTWAWNGTNWTQLSPYNSTSPRSTAAMVYDNSTGMVVLFGGSNATTTFGDTWIYTIVQAPTVTAISPSTGSLEGGTRVTIWGTGFAYSYTMKAVAPVPPTPNNPTALAGGGRSWFVPLDARVTIGGVPCAAVEVISPTELTCTTGANSAGALDVVVTVAGLDSTGGAGLFTHIDYLAPKFTG